MLGFVLHLVPQGPRYQDKQELPYPPAPLSQLALPASCLRLWQLEYQRSNDVFQPCFKTGRKPRLLSLLSYLKSISRPQPPSFLLIAPSHDLNLPQSTSYQTHFKQLNLKSIIMSDAA